MRLELQPLNSAARAAVVVMAVMALTISAEAETLGEADPIEVRPFFFALSVADAEASSAWYQRVFGFAVAREIDLPDARARIRLLERAGAFLELVESPEAQPLTTVAPQARRRHLVHGVFKIGLLTPDLDRALEGLERLDVPLRGEVFTESDGTMRSLQVEDPDGNVIQVFELLGD